MDQETLQCFRPLWVSEGPDKRVTTDLTALTSAEYTLYDQLCSNHFDECVRLEQERIAYEYLVTRLRNVHGIS
jgi:hypothetical protein